jgi:hypothetical protein
MKPANNLKHGADLISFIRVKPSWRLLWLALVLLGVCGCSKEPPPAPPLKPEPKPINGEAFIVLKSLETIKLSLLKISIVDAAEARSVLSNATRVSDEWASTVPKLAAAKERMKSENAGISDMRGQMDSTRQFYSNLWNQTQDEHLPLQYRQQLTVQMRNEAPQLAGQSNMIVILTKKKFALQEQIDSYLWTLRNCDAYCYLSGYQWTNVMASVVTDSDGKFSVKTPAGECYIFAVASRETAAGDEHYSWILSLTTNGPISLNNSNMLNLYSSANLNGVKP